MWIAVIGASVTGLITALMLGRDGHDVEVLDRDDLDPAADMGTAAKHALGPAEPQIARPHAASCSIGCRLCTPRCSPSSTPHANRSLRHAVTSVASGPSFISIPTTATPTPSESVAPA